MVLHLNTLYMKDQPNENSLIMNIAMLANGNMGAAMALVQLVKVQEDITAKLKECNLVGTDIYVLFSDICRRDIIKFIVFVSLMPKRVLIDAGGRQDYSGRDLPEVVSFMEAYDLLKGVINPE
jgi:hypothetical protein